METNIRYLSQPMKMVFFKAIMVRKSESKLVTPRHLEDEKVKYDYNNRC